MRSVFRLKRRNWGLTWNVSYDEFIIVFIGIVAFIREISVMFYLRGKNICFMFSTPRLKYANHVQSHYVESKLLMNFHPSKSPQWSMFIHAAYFITELLHWCSEFSLSVFLWRASCPFSLLIHPICLSLYLKGDLTGGLKRLVTLYKGNIWWNSALKHGSVLKNNWKKWSAFVWHVSLKRCNQVKC